MKIRTKEKDRALTLLFSGELDHHGAKDAMREIEFAIEAGQPQTLVLNFTDVTFMDSSGIAVVLRAQKRIATMGGSMTLEDVPVQARKVLETAGIDRLVKMA